MEEGLPGLDQAGEQRTACSGGLGGQRHKERHVALPPRQRCPGSLPGALRVQRQRAAAPICERSQGTRGSGVLALGPHAGGKVRGAAGIPKGPRQQGENVPRGNLAGSVPMRQQAAVHGQAARAILQQQGHARVLTPWRLQGYAARVGLQRNLCSAGAKGNHHLAAVGQLRKHVPRARPQRARKQPPHAA